MKIRKLITSFMLIVMMPPILSGCWDRTEINDVAFVIATGFDQNDQEEKTGEYRVSAQIPLPGAMGGSEGGGGGTGSQKPYYVDSGVGKNIRDSNENLQARMSRQLNFAHRRVIIIGETLAKKGFAPVLDVIALRPQSRISAFVLISSGPAIDVLNSSPHLERLPAEAIREMSKMGLGITVKDIINDINRPGKDPIVPIIDIIKTQNQHPEEQTDEVELKNVAILRNERLVFTTNKAETYGVMWMLNKMEGKSITFPISEDREANVKIISENLKMNYDLKNITPTFKIHLKTDTILMENESNLNLEDDEVYQDVKEKMTKEIETQLLSIINHAKEEKVDPFGFGWQLYRNDNDVWKKIEDEWYEILPDVETEIHVDADIQRIPNTGLKVEE